MAAFCLNLQQKVGQFLDQEQISVVKISAIEIIINSPATSQ